MSGGAIIAITILSCMAGYLINSSYQNKYNEPAVNWAAFAFQAFSVMGMLITWPNPDITGWFIAWTMLAIMSYIVGIIACKQHAEAQHAAQSDVWLAIIAQILLPLGVAIVVIIIIAMMLGVFGGGSKKKRK